jgi:hypothetical protein
VLPLRDRLEGKISLSGLAACIFCTDGVGGIGPELSRPEKNDRTVLTDLIDTPLRTGEDPPDDEGLR